MPVYLDELNEFQLKAVQAPRKPILVLAGPGTGKTRTLASRVAYQISKFQIPPERIVALTFSNKAAGEMQERLSRYIEAGAVNIRLSTIHSFCLMVLRKNFLSAGLDKNFSVADDHYQNRLLLKIARSVSFRFEEKKLSGIKLGFSNHIFNNNPLPVFSARIYDRYLAELNEHKLIDYDQILIKTKELFQNHPEILKQYQYLYEAVLVDEFQDTDGVQYEIIRLLAEKHRNIFVVADDDQSIYGWRGASPENIRKYMDDFKIEEPVILKRNYRNSARIINSALPLIAGTDRIDSAKEVFSESAVDGELMAHFFPDEAQEQEFVLSRLQSWLKQGTGLSEIAVLYPRHAIGDQLINTLIRNKIPFQQAVGKNLRENPQVQKILLYLRLVKDPSDQLILEDLVETELGQEIYILIQRRQKDKNISFKLAVNETAGDERLSLAARQKLAAFIGNLANLINLKTFFNFPRLVREIIAARRDLQSFYLQQNYQQLENLNISRVRLDQKHIQKIWVYHPDEHLAFFGTRLLAHLFPKEKIHIFKTDQREFLDARDIIFQLDKWDIHDIPSKIIAVWQLTNTRRVSSLSALFRWLQYHLVPENNHMFSDYVVFDLETTGRDTSRCGIVEIAAVQVRNGEIAATFSSLVNPGMPVESEAEAVHHISATDLAGAPGLDEVWPKFRKFVGEAVLIAHNGYQFDFKIIDRIALERNEAKIGKSRYDTLYLARNLFPDEKNSIDALAERFKLDTGTRHRALDDVQVLVNIFIKLRKIQQQREQLTAGEEFTEIVSLANLLFRQSSGIEDQVLIRAGLPKLLSPYSRVCKDYIREFELDAKEVRANLELQLTRSLEPDLSQDAGREFFESLLSVAEEFKTQPIDTAIAEFISYVSLIHPSDQLKYIDALSLLTFHAAKGLEFEKVVIMGMEDKQIPNFFTYQTDESDSRTTSQKMDEQLRLLYVAMTRARSEIVFTVVKNRDGREQKSSPFFQYIKDHLDVLQHG